MLTVDNDDDGLPAIRTGRPSPLDCEGHNGPVMPDDGIIDSPGPRLPADAVNNEHVDI